MRISRELIDELIAHAREEAPNECCGVIAVEVDRSRAPSPTPAPARRSQTRARARSTPAGWVPVEGTALEDGELYRAVRLHRAVNIAASPLRFEVDGRELLRMIEAIEEDGNELGAIYHSHTRTAPYPSQTDINFAANWPGVEWIIVGLADGEPPQVRSYLITGGEIEEVVIQETAI